MGPSESPPLPFDWETIARFVAGESPADEGAAVRAWLVAHPGDAALVAALDHTLDRGAPPAIDVERALRHLADRRRTVRALASAPTARRLPWRVALPLAAAATLLLVAGGARLRHALGAPDPRAASAAAPAERTVATAVGQRDSLHLPDGTRVVLAPDSRLTVAAGYGAQRRELTLLGTAFFDVRHDDARPFVVRAGGAVIRDVGTAFTVRADGPLGARVAVTEGTVELGTPGDSGEELLLHRGDVGALAPDGHLSARRGALPDDELAWTAGRLVFRDAPLDEVRRALRRWYGVDLRVDDPALAGRRLTASFDGEPAPLVLDVIRRALGVRLVQRGDGAAIVSHPQVTR